VKVRIPPDIDDRAPLREASRDALERQESPMRVAIPDYILAWLDAFFREKKTATLLVSLKDGRVRYYQEENTHVPPKEEWPEVSRRG
jgi:hypothetical protein